MVQQWAFSGISHFAHLKHVKCLSERDTPYDIGIIGAPFDTAVSYRPGPSIFLRFPDFFENVVCISAVFFLASVPKLSLEYCCKSMCLLFNSGTSCVLFGQDCRDALLSVILAHIYPFP